MSTTPDLREESLDPGALSVRRQIVGEVLDALARGEVVDPLDFQYLNLVRVKDFYNPKAELENLLGIAQAIHDAGVSEHVKQLLEA